MGAMLASSQQGDPASASPAHARLHELPAELWGCPLRPSLQVPGRGVSSCAAGAAKRDSRLNGGSPRGEGHWHAGSVPLSCLDGCPALRYNRGATRNRRHQRNCRCGTAGPQGAAGSLTTMGAAGCCWLCSTLTCVGAASYRTVVHATPPEQRSPRRSCLVWDGNRTVPSRQAPPDRPSHGSPLSCIVMAPDGMAATWSLRTHGAVLRGAVLRVPPTLNPEGACD